MPAAPSNNNVHALGRSEHISLASDVAESRAPPRNAQPLKQYPFGTGSRGATVAVSLLPDQFVAVEMPRSRAAGQPHVVDLRFVDSRPLAVRKIIKPLLYVGLALALLAAIATTVFVLWPNVLRPAGGVLTPIALGVLAAAAFALCYYFSSETLTFLSAHGRARVITITGPLGTLRRARGCASDIVAQIKLAQRRFAQAKPTQLRDEMREHRRLFEAGVLSEAQYNEASKRILQAHE